MLQQLSKERKVILGGDMRADSPGIYFLNAKSRICLIVNDYEYIHTVQTHTRQIKYCDYVFTGHCAKFGSYTMMDLNTKTIVDLQLVQVGVTNKVWRSVSCF